ncbi:GntR family transcriptional regulator [Streptomyces sp. NBC_01217]|uniref:GntR family transcriptional regulator n=1 Tax=Streptomyces sp. NBC_01217 TaxID=2903779 RepID=UPI002E0F68AC|nr:GntR family transcriptional regulator [Streptomyces sp. NBC_01217]
METLRPVRRTLLRDMAYEAIRDAIVRGAIPPGAPVRDADLAERLGLSRAPVRDALSRLCGEGLVESKPQSYTRVTRLVPRDVRDAAAVVRAMQELAARSAVPRLTDADVTAMREANDRFREATRRGDVADALRADDRLHDVLVTACGNRAVTATVERYTPLIRRLEWRQFGTASTAHGSAELHDRLIEACAGRDADAAARVTAEIWRALEELADEPFDTEADTEADSATESDSDTEAVSDPDSG